MHAGSSRKTIKSPHVCKALFGDDFKYHKSSLKQRVKFKIGDRLRIVRKKTFEKAFTPKRTEEVFIVDEVKSTQPIN